MNELRIQREAAGVSQYALARRAGVSRSRIQLAEAGTVELAAADRGRLEKALREIVREKCARLRRVITPAASASAAR